jgi:SAM-dependent methyltransferase
MPNNTLERALSHTDRDYRMLQESTSSGGVCQDRGVWKNYYNGDLGYLGYLPTFQNQTFLDILETKVRQNSQTNDTIFIDLGYGSGRALLDLSEYPPLREKVKLIGVGPPGRSMRWIETVDGKKLPPTHDELIQKGILLLDKNIVRICEVIPESSADVVVAVFSLYSIGYPAWEITKNIYSILKPGGVFITNNYSPVPITYDSKFLSEYLNKLGYPFEIHNTGGHNGFTIGGFSLQKTHPKLPDTIRPYGPAKQNTVSIKI